MQNILTDILYTFNLTREPGSIELFLSCRKAEENLMSHIYVKDLLSRWDVVS